MAKKTIKVKLTQKDMLKLAKELDDYAKKLDEKCKLFCQKLAERNLEAVKMHIDGISPFYKGSDLKVEIIEISGSNGKYKAVIRMSGEQCAFVEFGSGITFNGNAGSSKHPKGEELGMTIDSFNPNSKHPKDGSYTSNATNPSGWYKPDGEHTYGTPTYAPLYTGFMEMQSDIEKIAKEVFGNE